MPHKEVERILIHSFPHWGAKKKNSYVYVTSQDYSFFWGLCLMSVDNLAVDLVHSGLELGA